jgi:hypothetical protein
VGIALLLRQKCVYLHCRPDNAERDAACPMVGILICIERPRWKSGPLIPVPSTGMGGLRLLRMSFRLGWLRW